MGMYAPLRRPSKSFQSDWAEVWLQRDDGWEFKLYELAGFNPVEFKRIASECTLLEIVTAWKTMKALSEYAWNDGDA